MILIRRRNLLRTNLRIYDICSQLQSTLVWRNHLIMVFESNGHPYAVTGTFLSIATLHLSHGTRVHTHWKLEMRIKINVDAKLRVHADRRYLRFAMSHENIIYNLRFKIFLFIFKSFWYITFHLPPTRCRKRQRKMRRERNTAADTPRFDSSPYIELSRRKFKGYEQ